MRTYGTVMYNEQNRHWIVRCEPQVAMRLKRLFGKLGSNQQGDLWLSDTLETCRDLAWFIARYPMVIDGKDMARLEAREHQHKTLTTDIGRILGGEYTPTEIPLAIPLREYQRIAVDLAVKTRGTLIADDVGVGKTADGIGLLSLPEARPALVVTLTHLPKQWKAEIERFCPGMNIHILKKGTPYDFTSKPNLFNAVGIPDVIVSNYHKLNGWAGELAGKVKSVIFDEVQEVRHSGSAKYHAAKAIADQAEFRLGLSATPIHNYGGKIFNVMEVLRPGALGTRTEFGVEWCDTGYESKASIKDPKAFGSYARETGLMLRRTRADVGRELPGITNIPHVINADTHELDKIASSASELAKIILAQGGAGFDKMKASGEFDWRLRQATGIAKAPYVADFVRMLIEQDEPVLLYGWHREVYRLWADRLKDLNPVFFTGEESPNQKEAAKNAFLNGDTKLLIMSLRAGAGIDGLQKVCRTVVNGELDWSPSVHEQGAGRVFRDGQPDPVSVYWLIAESGSDPVISDVLGVKRGQLDGIRNPNADLVTKAQTDPERVKRLAEAYLKQRAA